MIATADKADRKTAAGLRVPAGLTQDERAAYERIPAKVDYVRHRSFSSPMAEEDLFGPSAPEVHVPHWRVFPDSQDEWPMGQAGQTTLDSPDEVRLFLRYNYARMRLGRLLDAQRRRKSLRRARAMMLWHDRVLGARSSLVRANMALVLAMAKRTRIDNVEFAELVGEGNMALLRSVEKFDVSRGFKFSTYACRAILKSFSRLATKTGRYRRLFPTEYAPELDRTDYDVMKGEIQRRDVIDSLRELLADNRANLSQIEQKVVMERFALDSGGKGRTLARVGRMVGLTNERVRQIQNLAMSKIRSALSEEVLVS